MLRTFAPALDRLNGGWLAFLFAAAARVVAFPLVDRLFRAPQLRPPLRIVGIVGSKGLPGFATMVLAILALDLVPSIPRSDPVNLAVMVLCGCAEYAALRWHAHVQRDATHTLGSYEQLTKSSPTARPAAEDAA